MTLNKYLKVIVITGVIFSYNASEPVYSAMKSSSNVKVGVKVVATCKELGKVRLRNGKCVKPF